jgi:hypothetical protein
MQIILFESPGEIGMPERHVWVIKRSIEELWHLTYLTDFIIIHGVQLMQCLNMQGRWLQLTFNKNAAIPRESREDS